MNDEKKAEVKTEEVKKDSESTESKEKTEENNDGCCGSCS